MRTGFLLLLLSVAVLSHGQKKNFGSWNVINTRITLAPKWEAFNELQLRSQSFYNDHFYHEIKGGVSYFLNKNFSLLMGVGKYTTYSDPGNFTKPVTANETRFWQQLTMNNYLDVLKFEHRYRVEQRWFKTGYRNRFRYRLNAAMPIAKKKIEPKTFYLGAFNEVFLTNKAPYFERNRFFAGIGYQISSYFSVQPGYVYQYDYRNEVGAGKHFFQLTLMIDIDGDKNPNERIPGNVD
ncbi:MAG: DUF2490 domain-containing protein [Terrimonas ferruginea]|jgi:hypothetical protein|uniref:DUF2490 domain-containing protein n=1 Tax=Terrimonas ferruginea TaxID=249 RepID=UPI000B065E85|nr:DUF2490 domain-containing protein [Terrimonas ferruginea]MBN8782772.1 DUF2490 domain-containing protein [Terrimonas ferruginea]